MILSFVLAAPGYAASVVATINGKPITDTDVTSRTTLMAKQGKTSSDNRRVALNAIIDDAVKLAHAANFGAVPSDADVDKELKKIRQYEQLCQNNGVDFEENRHEVVTRVKKIVEQIK